MQMDYRKRIQVSPEVMVGKPVIAGTRIPVEIIIKKLADNIDAEEILRDYPKLTREDIKAALFYASDLLENEKIYKHQNV